MRPDWMMNKKTEADLADNLFYVFVCLPDDGTQGKCGPRMGYRIRLTRSVPALHA